MVQDQPVLLGRIDLGQAGVRSKMLVGDIDGDGRMELVMVQADGGIDDRYVPHQVICVTAYDLDGRMLWQVGKPDEHAGGPGSDYPAQVYDIDGDGYLEVLCVMNDRFLVLDGRSGAVKASHALPDEHAHDCIIICNLRGMPHAQDIILKDRYRRLWALDRDMNLLWKYEGNPGHYPWAYDYDGDGRDEVMAGYDMLDHDGTKLWSCRDLKDHADCIWVGDVDGDPGNGCEIVIGGSVTVMYNAAGDELWRYEGSIESQHIALGRYRDDLPGLQIAGLDRIVRGDGENRLSGKDGIFLLDLCGREVWKEDRHTPGWLTIIETIRNWDEGKLDYILAYRRGGGVMPTIYDGHLNPVAEFPMDGYVVHADLIGSGLEQVIIYNDAEARVYGSKPLDLLRSASGRPLPQPKRLYSSTLYPGGEY